MPPSAFERAGERAAERTAKFAYRIRTRHGLLVERLVIQGRDEADAERKLRQMYLHCEIVERIVLDSGSRPAAADFEDVMELVSK